MAADCKYIYGPVPSRRLGRSLGIDLVPFKTCTYDCIYCQLGRTTHKTMKRRAYFPVNEIVAMLSRRPCTAEIVAAGLRMNVNAALKKLEQLVAAGTAYTLSENKKTYYKSAEPSGPLAEGRISLIHSNG